MMPSMTFFSTERVDGLCIVYIVLYVLENKENYTCKLTDKLQLDFLGFFNSAWAIVAFVGIVLYCIAIFNTCLSE